jgi:hypothetical protein
MVAAHLNHVFNNRAGTSISLRFQYSKPESNTQLGIGFAACTINRLIAIQVDLLDETKTEICFGSGNDIDSGTLADRIDVGKAIDGSMAIKYSHIRLCGGPLYKNVLPKWRILGHTGITLGPFFEG